MENAAIEFPPVADCLRALQIDGCKREVGGDQPGTQQDEPEKRGRQQTPSYLLVDSQSVKTNYEADEVGFHGGKKVKGRSRQVAVDTQGNIWGVHVHAANASDTVEGCVLADLVLPDLPGVEAICADSGYKGTFVDYLREKYELPVHITERKGKGFNVVAMRWIVERTFGWNNGQRRLSKDYEKNPRNSESFVYLAAISRALRTSSFN